MQKSSKFDNCYQKRKKLLIRVVSYTRGQVQHFQQCGYFHFA